MVRAGSEPRLQPEAGATFRERISDACRAPHQETDGANSRLLAKLRGCHVFDGMIAAGGSLYMSTVDGKVVRLGGMGPR